MLLKILHKSWSQSCLYVKFGSSKPNIGNGYFCSGLGSDVLPETLNKTTLQARSLTPKQTVEECHNHGGLVLNEVDSS